MTEISTRTTDRLRLNRSIGLNKSITHRPAVEGASPLLGKTFFSLVAFFGSKDGPLQVELPIVGEQYRRNIACLRNLIPTFNDHGLSYPKNVWEFKKRSLNRNPGIE
jgi:hypothetical protein